MLKLKGRIRNTTALMARDRANQFNQRPMSTLPSQNTLNNDEELNDVYQMVESVTHNIDKLYEMLPSLERIHKRALDADAQSKSHHELEKRNNNAARQIAKVRNDIAQLDRYVNEFQSQPAQQRVVKTQQQKLRQKFLDFISEYQDMEFEFRGKYKKRVERQLKIVHPNATNAEISDMVDNQESQQMFGQQVMQSKRHGETKAALDEVEKRHQDLMQIEKTVIELHELFTEMTQLIQQQGEVLDDIETHVANTVTYTEQANQEIDKAIEHRISTRKKLWCCMCLGVVLLIVVVILVLIFAFPSVWAKIIPSSSSTNATPAKTT